tara:strand:+ start:854 stop:1084 length:231 start_codon:yes stop_codon:yes gene_type:complete
MTELVEKGDTIKVVGPMGNVNTYLITRVTKTLAISSTEKARGHAFRFKRLIGWDMAHPYEQWNRCEYTVIKPSAKE